MTLKLPFADSYFPPIHIAPMRRTMFRYSDTMSDECRTCFIWQDRYRRLGVDYQEVSRLCDAVIWENVGIKEAKQLLQRQFEVELHKVTYRNNTLVQEANNHKTLIEEMKRYAKWRESQMQCKLEEESDLRERIELLKSRVKDEKRTVESLKKETLDQASQLDDEKFNLTEMKGNIDSLTKEKIEEISAVDKLTEEQNQLKEEHERLNQTYLAQKLDYEHLQEEIEHLKTSLEKEEEEERETMDTSKVVSDYESMKKKYENLRMQHKKVKKDSADQLKKQAMKTSSQRQENARLQREIRGLTSQLESLNREHLSLQEKYRKELTKNANLTESESRLMADMRIMQRQRDVQEKDSESRIRQAFTAEADLDHFKVTEYAPLKQELVDLQRELGKRRAAIDDLRKELKQTKSEKENLLTRLSEVMSSKITEGNLNVADLSDERRPTKIADDYSELYTNEWTDALEEQMTVFRKDEKTAIVHLLTIITKTHSQCHDLSQTFHNSIHKAATRVPNKMDATLLQDGPRGSVTTLLNKTIRQLRISMADNFRNYLSKDLQKIWDDEGIQVGVATGDYARKCLDLCWDMSVKNPPMILMSLPVDGSDVNKEAYRFYRESGTLVKLVVWPTLSLYKDGPIMVKGVVQGLQGHSPDECQNPSFDV